MKPVKPHRSGKRARALLCAVWCLASPAAVGAPAGAAACSGCHAPAGDGGAVPSLLGRASADIVAAMRDFRTGARPATVMDRIAKGFSDEETRAIAEWLAGRPEEVIRHAQP